MEATGEISRIGYREEVEAAMRTEDMSGISLLGLQDFPGQGTALVGMINSHMESKPFDFAKPEHFASFFRAQLPLVALPKYTYEVGETLEAEVRIANYGKEDLTGPVTYCLEGADVKQCGELPAVTCPAGGITAAGKIRIALDRIAQAVRLDLTVEQAGICNRYPIWVYPAVRPVCPAEVYEIGVLDEKAVQVLQEGGKVYLSPDADKGHLPSSIQTQFTTDFWSVGTFAAQEGGMGQLIDVNHPILRISQRNFTQTGSGADGFPESDHIPASGKSDRDGDGQLCLYASDGPAGRIPVRWWKVDRIIYGTAESAGISGGRALLDAIYQYMTTEEFSPKEEITMKEIQELVK